MKLISEIPIINKLGLHLRAAAQLVQTANLFRSEVWFRKEDYRVNGKSIMGVMTLDAGKGTLLTVEVEGEDADRCLEAIRRLAADHFGDDKKE
jgi:phosphocarrier protein HPr